MMPKINNDEQDTLNFVDVVVFFSGKLELNLILSKNFV